VSKADCGQRRRDNAEVMQLAGVQLLSAEILDGMTAPPGVPLTGTRTTPAGSDDEECISWDLRRQRFAAVFSGAKQRRLNADTHLVELVRDGERITAMHPYDSPRLIDDHTRPLQPPHRIGN
jgi:hypothetical protein